MNFITAYGGKILTFLTLALGLLTADSSNLHLNAALMEWFTALGLLLRAAEEVFVSSDSKGAAVAAIRASRQSGRAHVGFLATLAVLGLGGCALLASPTFDLFLQAAIQAAVSALLAKSPGSAALIEQEANTLAALASGTGTAASIQSQADAVIAASTLPIGDKLAFEDLVAAGSDLLQQEASKIPTNAKSGVTLVFTDIANAAQLYTAASQNAHVGAIILR